MAIGDKCQSARTYHDKYFETSGGLDGDALINHGVKAMRASAAETKLTENNVTIGLLDRGQHFRNLSKEEIRAVLAAASKCLLKKSCNLVCIYQIRDLFNDDRK